MAATTTLAYRGDDINSFIRAQKNKIAQDRETLQQRPLQSNYQLELLSQQQQNWPSSPRNHQVETAAPLEQYVEERPIAEKLGEWERRRQAYNSERREEYSRLMALDRARKDAQPRAGDNIFDSNGNMIPGMRDEMSQKLKQQAERNSEYNMQKQAADEKLRNRFAHRKPPTGFVQSQPHNSQPRQQALPSSVIPQHNNAPAEPLRAASPPVHGYPSHLAVQGYVPPPPQFAPSQFAPPHGANVRFNEDSNRLRDLEKQVELLRNQNRVGLPESIEQPLRHQAIQRNPQLAAQHQQFANENNGGASLQINDHESAQARKRAERNREYNEMMAAKSDIEESRRQWRRQGDSPRYEDILTQKRSEEMAYRRLFDPEFEAVGPARPRPQPTKSVALEQAENILAAMDSQYDNQKMRLMAGVGTRNRAPRPKDDWMQNVNGRGGVAEELDFSLNRATGAGAKSFRNTGARAAVDNYATLPVGRPDSAQVRQKNKEVYKQQLQEQMRQDEEKRRAEKMNAKISGETRTRSMAEGLNFLGEARPLVRNVAGGSAGSLLGSGGVLDFQQSGLMPYNSPTDDAYFYYARKNPLEVAGGVGQLESASYVDLGSRLAARSVPEGNQTARAKHREMDFTPAGMVFSSEDERKQRNRQQQVAFAQELQRQMSEVKRKNLQEKKEREEYERRKEAEIAAYNPFGRGGGGAPLTDESGNVKANLRELRNGEGGGGGAGGGATSRPDFQFTKRLNESFNNPRPPMAPANLSSKSPRQTNVYGEVTHARGGHGIFGEPENEAQRVKKERYQEELRLQLEAQKAEKEAQRQREKEEELREERRIEQQRLRIQSEFEAEQRKQREKEEEERRKNEEISRQAEERKAEMQKKRREANAAPAAVAPPSRAKPTLTDNYKPPPPSPPVPTLRNAAQQKNYQQPPPPQSPQQREPVPHSYRENAATTTEPVKPDEDVLSQLARMRSQLQTERRKVENALSQQQEQVEVFDPRLQHRRGIADQAANTGYNGMLVTDPFEYARRGQGPVAVKRNVGSSKVDLGRVDSAAVADFMQFKRRDGSAQARMRQAYPDTPQSESAFEAQQLSLLREQEARLNRLRRGRKDSPLTSTSQFAPHMPGMNPVDLGLRPGTRDSVQLVSDSAFLDTNGALEFGNGHLNTPYKVDENTAFGSETSLDIERLTRRNEARLAKLQRLQQQQDNDGVSLVDPELVLDRFMARDTGLRPPSGHTLLDDSWMQPGY